MSHRLLVVSSVHPADDPRIRFKYIPTLADDFDVSYATKAPAPVEIDGFAWHRLAGGRLRRWFASARLMVTAGTDVIVIHDPELIPAGIIATLVRRVPVVFDLHENVPAQVSTSTKVPALLRSPVRAIVGWWLRVAEGALDVTLAETGYGSLFRKDHPVFPNYPDPALLPPVDAESRNGFLYVGDVTEQRGAITLLEAAAIAGVGPITYVGRCREELQGILRERAEDLGVTVTLEGWKSYPEAMARVASARAGISPLHDTPNYRHSLPTKTLEYLALGTPVIATDLPGTSDIIGGLPGVILAKPGDARSLAEALGSVDEATVSAASDGASAVRARFRWPEEQVRSFYLSLLPS